MKSNPDVTKTVLTAFIGILLLVVFYVSHIGEIVAAIGTETSGVEELLVVSAMCIFAIGIVAALSIPLFFEKTLVKILFHHLLLLVLSLLIIYVVFDTKLFILTGNHFYDQFVWQSIQNPNVNREIQLSAGTVFISVAFIALIFLLPYLVYTLLRKYLHLRLTKVWMTLPLVLLFLCGAPLWIYSSNAGKVSAAFLLPLPSGSIIAELNVNAGSKLYAEYKNVDLASLAPIKEKKDILFIVAESFRSDMQAQTPNLRALQQMYGNVQSTHHFCGVNVTEKSVFTLLYGIQGLNYEQFSSEKVSSLPLNLLRANGYELKGFSSSALKTWNHGSFMTSQFDTYVEHIDSLPWYNDSVVVDEIRSAYQKRDPSKPVFYFVFLNSTHHNYHYPKTFEKHIPVMPEDYNHFLGDDSLSLSQNKIFNRYKNSVLYVDYLLKKITTIFEPEIKKENLVMMFTGDHAEEFWDRGLLGHGTSNLYNCRTQVPLLLHLPGKEKTTVPFSSHVQVMPTILNYAGADSSVFRFFDDEAISPQNEMSLISASDFSKNGELCLLNRTMKYWITIQETGIKEERALTFADVDTVSSRNQLLKFQKEVQDIVWKYKR